MFNGGPCYGDAARLIMWEDADVMVAGGAEAAICPIGLAGFVQRGPYLQASMTGRVKFVTMDKDRDGFVMGDGAGIVVLEELEHAKRAKIYAEIVGYGMSGDAHHITAPAEDGDGAYCQMKGALERAEICTEEIDYVNAHGTSTPLGDEIEFNAVKGYSVITLKIY